MRSLEEVARDLFERYSERTLGRKVAWHKLSHERQAAWMDDALLILEEMLDTVEKDLILKVSDKQPQASYEAGVLHGMKRERMRMQTKVHSMKEFYLEQLQDFLEE